MPKCVGTTAKGNPCKNEPVPGSTFCGNHRPNSEVFSGLMEEDTLIEEPLIEEPVGISPEVAAWELDTTPERAFFEEVYEIFCEELKDDLSFVQFTELALRLNLIKEEAYDVDVHGDNYEAKEGELVIVKCK